MSNIVFKGDTVKNFGEYLPVPYIEKVVVTNPAGVAFIIEIQFSVLFLAEDEPNYTNMENTLNDTRFFYRFAFQENDIPLSKREVIGPTGIRSLEAGAEISIDSDFERSEEEYYDSQDRRVIKYTATETFVANYRFVGWDPPPKSRNVYLYLYSKLEASLSGPIANRMLATSEVAYEKIMSKDLIIQKEEKVVYFDQEGMKYSQVPLLGLDRSYYKTQSVTREVVATSVMRLVNKFKGGSAAGLSDAVTSIEYVLSTESETENLLVELDKVRRSFPNKTNNNPTGNLYAAFATLLQNINSAFLPSEKLLKDKYLTGKVSDQRTLVTPSTVGDTRNTARPYSHYISMPIVDRKISYTVKFDGTLDDTGFANNTGLYLLDYENLVIEKAKIFEFFNVDRFFEICPEDKLAAYKAALFSKFKIGDVRIRVYTHGDTPPEIPGPGDATADQYKMMDFDYDLIGDYFSPLFDDAIDNYITIDTTRVDGGIRTDVGASSTFSTIQDITILNYNLSDSGRQTFAIKYEYKDRMVFDNYSIESDGVYKSTGQRHVLDTIWEDYTINMAFDYIQQWKFSRTSLDEYLTQAEEECSYNNITSNFNNFFTNSVKKFWEDESYAYPWELAPTLYSLISYLRTDQFSSLDEARKYANEVMYNISPETGNLTQLRAFMDIMNEYGTSVIGDLEQELSAAHAGSGRIEERYDTIKPGAESARSNTQMYLSQLIDEAAYASVAETIASDETTEGDE